MVKIKLTDHQKRCLAALVSLSTGTMVVPMWLLSRRESSDLPVGFYRRLDIGRVVQGDFRGITKATMKKLRDAGLVEPESEITVQLVAAAVCTCGCDRWRATQAGIDLASTWNIRIIPHPPYSEKGTTNAT